MAFLKTSETSASAALNSERMFRSSARPRWLARCSGDSVRSRKSVKIRTCLKTPTARLPDFNPVRCGVTASTGTVSSSIGLKRIRLALNPNIFPAPRKIPKASSASCWACLSGLCINVKCRFVESFGQKPKSLNIAVSCLCCSCAERQNPKRHWPQRQRLVRARTRSSTSSCRLHYRREGGHTCGGICAYARDNLAVQQAYAKISCAKEGRLPNLPGYLELSPSQQLQPRLDHWEVHPNQLSPRYPRGQPRRISTEKTQVTRPHFFSGFSIFQWLFCWAFWWC